MLFLNTACGKKEHTAICGTQWTFHTPRQHHTSLSLWLRSCTCCFLLFLSAWSPAVCSVTLCLQSQRWPPCCRAQVTSGAAYWLLNTTPPSDTDTRFTLLLLFLLQLQQWWGTILPLLNINNSYFSIDRLISELWLRFCCVGCLHCRLWGQSSVQQAIHRKTRSAPQSTLHANQTQSEHAQKQRW